MFKFVFNNFIEKERGTGALIDERDEEEKEKDYKFTEMVTSADPVNWKEKSKEEWRKFPIYDQDGSGSCVAQTLSKLLGILYYLRNNDYVHFSATHIYQRRKNKPSGGMYPNDALEITRDGVTLEELVPSQDMNDRQMDSIEIPKYKEEVGDVFKINNYVKFETGNIDKIASTIQKTDKAVMVWFYFTRDEWNEVPEVKNENLGIRDSETLRHSVAAVDYTIYNGKKALIIDDSWGIGHAFNGQRVITEDFFEKRNYFAAYPIKFRFNNEEEKDEIPEDIKYTFTEPLEFSSKYKTEEDVVHLQDILRHEGFFPENIESTGYYGAITAKAVLKFQKKYDVASEEELNSLEGKRVGPKTREKLNSIYGK